MKTNQSTNTNRRTFLKTSGSVTLLIGASGLLPTFVACDEVKGQNASVSELTAWVRLFPNGKIVIYNPAAEMGQGSMTSLPLIFAEEMDADWTKVSVEFSPQESDLYGSPGWSPGTKLMFTVGSRTTNSYYQVMRKAGAQAKYVMHYSASKHWNVPIEELKSIKGVISHEATGKQMTYGDLTSKILIPEIIPEISDDQLKSQADFQLIGKEISRVEIPEKVNGSAQFAIDVQLPNMVYGVLERGNIHGAKPTLLNELEISSMPGVLKIVKFEYAIGLVTKRLEQGLLAKKQLKIDWSEPQSIEFNSEQAFETYEAIAKQPETGKIINETGKLQEGLANAAQVYEFDYKNDYVCHAQMEPLNAVVQVSADLQNAELWVGSQQGSDTKLGVPDLLGISPKNVKVNLQYLGGGFGRRSMNDFVIECATLAREVAPKPVKLIWTREDDMTYGAYRPISLQRLKAGVDAAGNITSLSHLVIGDGGHLVAGGVHNRHYNIPNQLAEWRGASHGIRLKHWRAVGHGPNKFAIECVLDEIALQQQLDPADLRRKLMVKSPKALATLEKALELSNWNESTNPERAKGISFVEHGSFGTGICEISVNRSNGKIKVHKWWIALDAGVIIHPDNVKAQMEGGIIMGMSSVLNERITIENGEIQQSNYHNYPLLRMVDVPDSIETALMESDAQPEGVGETATPMVAGAIANAFLKLTGKRLTHLPFTPDRVLAVLQS
jgi:isoquinoline 1-oxidoreductase beta subunit